VSTTKSSQLNPATEVDPPGTHVRIASLALFVCVAYYLGSRIGLALTFQPHPISTLWPPNAILLAGLLLAPQRHWWVILLGALPAHFAAELQGGVPTAMVFAWFLTNCTEALVGALAIRAFVPGTLRFDSFPHVVTFIVLGAFLGTFVSTFLDTALVKIIGWGEGTYWDLWRVRFFSNTLATLTLVPVIVVWATSPIASLRRVPLRSHVEAALLTLGLLVVSYIAFGSYDGNWTGAPVFLYAPAPFLLWAALRFGPRGSSTALLLVVFVAIWGAIHGHGPFVVDTPAQSAFSVQIFLSTLAIGLLLLAALIRESERARDSLREKQEQLELALSAGQIGTWEWDIERSSGSWSEATRSMFGRGPRTHPITAEMLIDMIHPADREAVAAGIRNSTAGGGPFELEYRVVRPDGAVRRVLGKGRVLSDKAGRPVTLIGVNVDVTELREAEDAMRIEEAVRRSEAHFHQLADTMPHMIWAARPDGTVDYCNQRWYEIAPATLLPMARDGWADHLHAEDRGTYLGAWHRSTTTGHSFEVECRFLFPERDQYRWQLARALPVRDLSGQIVRWYGTLTDIHDRKRAEQVLRDAGAKLEEKVEERTAELLQANHALIAEIGERTRAEQARRASEAQFSKAFHGSPDPMVIVRRADGTIVEVNDRWQTLFGITHSEAVGRALADLGVFPSRASYDALTAAGARGAIRDLEVRMRTRGGTTLQVLVAADALEIEGEHCIIAILRDVTEQRRMEGEAREQRTQLTHLTRVAILGELTGALAHELNQPLTAILSNAQATQRMLDKQPVDMAEVRESIKDIIDQDKRAGEVIRRLRTLLKRGESQHQRLDVNEIVREAIDLAHGDLVTRSVNLRARLGEGLPAIVGDRVQLEQVLLNLIVNACEEMSGVEAGKRHLELSTAHSREGNVLVSVADSGPGIPDARLKLLFEPFFTTKENGLGLGLSISRSIANAHGGRLWAENGPLGATFHLELPAWEESHP
jgi:PAS domain S-box-containing protein